MAQLNQTCIPRREWHTTTETLNRLWDVINRRRKGTMNVTVPVADLINVLRDHATSATELEG